MGPSSSAHGTSLLTTLTNLVNDVLAEGVPEDIWLLFYGGSLCALTKDSEGVRPIVPGNTLQRLTTKVASKPLLDTLGDGLRPNQLGFGTKRDGEAAADTAWQYTASQTESRVFLKFHVSNAFNCLRRDMSIEKARTKVPYLYKLFLASLLKAL